MKTRIALVGTGHWGPNIAHSMQATGMAEMAWLCDLETDNLARAAKHCPGARTTTDLADILADPDVKAVAVSTPTATHYPELIHYREFRRPPPGTNKDKSRNKTSQTLP